MSEEELIQREYDEQCRMLDSITEAILEIRHLLRHPPRGGVGIMAARKRIKALVWAGSSAIFLTGGGHPDLMLQDSEPAVKRFKRACRGRLSGT